MKIRKISAIFLVLALLIPMVGCQQETPPEETVAVYLLESHTKSMSGKELERQEYTYNERGQLIQHTEYLKGDKYARAEYSYDSHGNQTVFALHLETGGMGENWTKEFEYDSQGCIIRQTGTYWGDPSYTYTFSYDENGKLINQIISEPTGELHTGTDMQYDETGKLSREIIYFNPEKLDPITLEYTYDAADRLIQITQHRGEHSFIKELWEYDKDGKLLSESHCDGGDVPTTSMEYLYTQDGKLQTEIIYFGRSEHHRLQYFYDNTNHVTRYNEIHPAGAVWNHTYTYKPVNVPKSQLEQVLARMEEFDLPYYII